MVSEQYYSVVDYVKYGAFIECFRMLGNLLANASQMTKQTYFLIYSYGFGGMILIFMFLLSYWLDLSAEWACLILLMSSFVSFLSNYFLMGKLIPFHLDSKRWIFSFIILCVYTTGAAMWKGSFLIIDAIVSLCVISCSSLFCMFLLLRNNLSFQRLISIKLPSERS